jgi:hypothetical protein
VSLPDSSSEDIGSERPRGVLVPKARTTIYTTLLGIAALALFICCAVLAWEIFKYGSITPPATLR